MRTENVIRAFLFIVFSTTGVAALGGSILCDELAGYYRKKLLLKKSRESTEKLKSLNADYDALLGRLENDPELFKRISPAVLGNEPNDPNTVYPQARAEQLAAARKTLADLERRTVETEIPAWVSRCSQPRKRIVLFAAGSALVLISFACFGAQKEPRNQQDHAS